MEILTILFGGGATGLLGTLLSQVFSWCNKKQQLQELSLTFEHEIRLQEMQLKSLRQETEREIFIAETTANSEALQGAYAHDTNVGKPSTWVVDAIKLFRPTITLILVLLTGAIYFTTNNLMIQATIVDAIIFCTIAAMTFWFGDRSIAKNVMSNRNSTLPWHR
jgi:hypothetical protein